MCSKVRFEEKYLLPELEGKIIFVWFSCGAASAVALKLTKEVYGRKNTIRAFNNPVIEEHPDNRRFLTAVEGWTGVKIEVVKNPAYPDCSAEKVWRDKKAMSFPKGAPCTLELKRTVRLAVEMFNPMDYVVFGFTSEEGRRHDRRVEEGDPVLPVMLSKGVTKLDCFRILREAGIPLPEIYSIPSPFGSGFPNANCVGCVKATSATYWNHVRCTFPEVFSARAALSRELGARLARCHPKFLPFCEQRGGEWYDTRSNESLHKINKRTGRKELVPPRIYLDELPLHARGESMKNMAVECGVVCAFESKEESTQ